MHVKTRVLTKWSLQKLESYRNTYVNLALPLVTMSEPFPPATETAKLDSGDWVWSLWDRVDVDIGDVTLQKFIDYIQEKYKLTVSMLSYGNSMIYCDFWGSAKKKKERLAMKYVRFVQDA